MKHDITILEFIVINNYNDLTFKAYRAESEYVEITNVTDQWSYVGLGSNSHFELHQTEQVPKFTEDGQHVLFIFNKNSGSNWDLYSIETNSPSTSEVRIDTDVYTVSMGIKAATNQFIYSKADGLYLAVLGAVGSVKVSSDFAVSSAIYNPKQTPDLKKIIFSAAHDAPGVVDLYSFDIENSELIKINTPFENPDSDIYVTQPPILSPDGSMVLFKADREVAGKDNIYISDL